jgi:hypothetical protein
MPNVRFEPDLGSPGSGKLRNIFDRRLCDMLQSFVLGQSPENWRGHGHRNTEFLGGYQIHLPYSSNMVRWKVGSTRSHRQLRKYDADLFAVARRLRRRDPRRFPNSPAPEIPRLRGAQSLPKQGLERSFGRLAA